MKYIYLIFALLFFPVASSAGMAVSDSGAYTYWAEQIKRAQDQIKKLQAVISEAQAIKQETMNVYGTLHGSYDRAKGFLDGMNSLMEKIDNSPNLTKDQLKKWLATSGNGSFEDLVNPDDVIGTIFTDPRNPGIKVGQKHDQKFNTRQIALRDSIKMPMNY